MNKIKLTNNYNLLISRKVTKKEILNFIENKLGKKVAYCIDGATSSYIIVIRNQDDNYETSLEVSVGIINNIYITTISEDIEGELINGYETFKEDVHVLSAFCEEYPGILLIKYYKTITYSNLYKTCYSINYDKDSIEYKLFSLFVNDTKNIYEAIAFTELLKNKKENILEIFK